MSCNLFKLCHGNSFHVIPERVCVCVCVYVGWGIIGEKNMNKNMFYILSCQTDTSCLNAFFVHKVGIALDWRISVLCLANAG